MLQSMILKTDNLQTEISVFQPFQIYSSVSTNSFCLSQLKACFDPYNMSRLNGWCQGHGH